jgi:hypothetical protein
MASTTITCGVCGGSHGTTQHTAAITAAAATARLIRQGGARSTASAAVLAVAAAGPDAVAAAGPGFGRQSKTARKRAKQQAIAAKRRTLMDDDSDDDTSTANGSATAKQTIGTPTWSNGSVLSSSYGNGVSRGLASSPSSSTGSGSLGRSPSSSFPDDLNLSLNGANASPPISSSSHVISEVKDVADAPLLDARGRATIPMDDLSMDALIELTRSSATLARLQALTALRSIPRDLLGVIAQYCGTSLQPYMLYIHQLIHFVVVCLLVAVSLDALGEWFEKRGRWRDAFRYYSAAMDFDGSVTATYKCGMIHLWGMEAGNCYASHFADCHLYPYSLIVVSILSMCVISFPSPNRSCESSESANESNGCM